MIHPNTHDPSTPTIPALAPGDAMKTSPAMSSIADPFADIATRTKLRAKQQFHQNRLVVIGAGALVIASSIFVVTSIPNQRRVQTAKASTAPVKEESTQNTNAGAVHSLFPITDSGRPMAKEAHEGFLNEKDLERSITQRSRASSAPTAPSNAPGTLGSIPPFGPDQPGWQAPPYQAGTTASATDAADLGKAEREAMEKSSLVYIRNISAGQIDSQSREQLNLTTQESGLGLSTGTRLRARLESAASTAVRAPVLAVVEYTYERDGQIVVPAGAKAVGHIQDADRSGYVHIQFESLIMPDGATVPIQAIATDLQMRPLKGKVDGKSTGKNVLVKSLSGIGEAGTLLLGRGSLNHPFSESDLMRERVSNNIGEVGNEEVSRLPVTQRIVVTIPGDTPVYVVLEQTPRANSSSAQSRAANLRPGTADAEELRQLLQLQRELNRLSTSTP